MEFGTGRIGDSRLREVKVRVLIHCPAIGTESGSGIRARLIVEGLRSCGDDVCILSREVPSDLAGTGASIRLLAEGDGVEEAICREGGSFRPDIVYGITEASADAVSDASKRIGVPVAFDLHGLGFVEVLELGAGYGPRYGRAKNSLRWLSRIRKADAVTVANPCLLPVLKWLNPRAEPVIGMTDVSRFRPEGDAVRPGTGKETIRVLYAGNYFRWQGVDLLLDAIRMLPGEGDGSGSGFEFTLIGSVGKRGEQLDKWKSWFPAGRVRFLDSVGYAQIADYYRGADVTVLPRPFLLSTYLAFPQKLVDSMASGRVVVATDIAPHRWALASPEAGILCPATAKGIAAGILRTKDPKLRERLSESARREAVDRYCHLKQSRRIRAIFSGVLSGS
jgi:glycosyltransferase involved in cell wall biosynthesis